MTEEGVQETFISHLIELRERLVRTLVVVGLCFLPAFFYASELYDLLAQPMMNALPEGSRMIATGVITPFFIPMKIALMVAFLVALPYLLYQAWAFVAPGLYAHEKKMVLPLVVSSTLLFFAGMAFCYFFVFGTVFKFISSFAPKSISVAPDIEAYFNFVLGMFVAFGVTFEVPVVVVVLVLSGIVSVEKLREIRPYVIVGAFVVAAVVTPPDVVSQLMLAIPLCILYELGIFVSRFIEKRKPAVDAGAAEG
ncbi:MAG: twin-arginine translocase subunit TatC [Betaproteobacteria bacterium]|nr:twin-arginine translocase subunit TatC [Betaproteobacteria bacterium]